MAVSIRNQLARRKVDKLRGGIDSAQAITLALQKIGTEIYFGDYHKSGNLFWESPGKGYGFPLPPSARDLLIGDDAKFF